MVFFYLKLFFVKLTDRILHYTSYWVTWAEYIHVFIIHRFLNHDSVFLGGFLARCEITRELVMKWLSKCINFWICHLFVFAYISFSVNRQSIILNIRQSHELNKAQSCYNDQVPRFMYQINSGSLISKVNSILKLVNLIKELMNYDDLMLIW